MRATHTDYLHPGHLRVETGLRYKAWNAAAGHFERTAVCMAPSANGYARLNRKGLPKWRGGMVVDGLEVEVPAK